VSPGRYAELDDDDFEEEYIPPKTVTAAEEDESSDDSEDSTYGPASEAASASRSPEHKRKRSNSSRKSNFASALLRAGTKSTKDSTLDKPLRKSPGRLLETAGRSLLQRRPPTALPSVASTSSSSSAASRLFDSCVASGGLLGGNVSGSKLSFGLYR
jgi:hypothetical protein